jgi:hypothetical protein
MTYAIYLCPYPDHRVVFGIGFGQHPGRFHQCSFDGGDHNDTGAIHSGKKERERQERLIQCGRVRGRIIPITNAQLSFRFRTWPQDSVNPAEKYK